MEKGTPRYRAEFEYRRFLFEEKFRRKGDDECWEWLAAQTKVGTGMFKMGELWRAAKPAPVAAWFFYRDPNIDLDAKVQIRHLCGNHGCVNPRHLYMVGGSGLVEDIHLLQYLSEKYPHAREQLRSVAEILKKGA